MAFSSPENQNDHLGLFQSPIERYVKSGPKQVVKNRFEGRKLLHRILSISLRALGLGSRLLLFVSLGYFLPPEDVGRFGLVAATVTFLVSILGADFYIVTNRDICVVKDEAKLGIVKQTLPIFLVTYILTTPFLIWLFNEDYLPLGLTPVVLIILVFEHLGLESYRILIALGRPVLASLSIFLRLGAWAIAASFLMVMDETTRNIETVMTAWAIGNGSATILGIIVITRLPRIGWRAPFDVDWIYAGLRIAAPFLLATLCLRALTTFDRYLMEYFTAAATVGAYVFYAGISAAIPAFVDAALISFAMPKILKAASSGDRRRFEADFHLLRKHVFLATFLLATGAFFSMLLISHTFEDQVYRANLDMAVLVLIAFVISTLASVYNLDLYAHRNDAAIILSHLVGVVVFLLAVGALSFLQNRLVVPLALIVAQGSILFVKARAARQRRKRAFVPNG